MTAQEKYLTTVQCMRLVSANYHLIKRKSAKGGEPLAARRKLRALEKWLEAIDSAHAGLKRKAGKSMARVRKDQLVARVIEMMVFEQAGKERMRQNMGCRPVTGRYVDGLMEEGIQAVMEAAQRKGLLG